MRRGSSTAKKRRLGDLKYCPRPPQDAAWSVSRRFIILFAVLLAWPRCARDASLSASSEHKGDVAQARMLFNAFYDRASLCITLLPRTVHTQILVYIRKVLKTSLRVPDSPG
ncbi:hypothetical protein MRX96_042937 [Rhipicephalus microplus]